MLEGQSAEARGAPAYSAIAARYREIAAVYADIARMTAEAQRIMALIRESQRRTRRAHLLTVVRLTWPQRIRRAIR